MKKFMIIFLLILFASKSFAEGPSVTTKWLMRDSLTMFEWGLLQLDEEIKEAINSGVTENKLSELAFTEGHKLSDSGYALVQKGITSVDEILRITSEK